MKSKKPKKKVEIKTLEGARMGQYIVQTQGGEKSKAWYDGDSILLYNIPHYKLFAQINGGVTIFRFSEHILSPNGNLPTVKLIKGKYESRELSEEEIRSGRLEELFDENFMKRLTTLPENQYESKN